MRLVCLTPLNGPLRSRTLARSSPFQRLIKDQMKNRPTLKSDHGWDSWDWNSLSDSCLREARRLLRSEQDAQEAAQDALLRAWRGRSCQGRRLPGSRLEMRCCSGYVMRGTLRNHVWLAWRECPREL